MLSPQNTVKKKTFSSDGGLVGCEAEFILTFWLDCVYIWMHSKQQHEQTLLRMFAFVAQIFTSAKNRIPTDYLLKKQAKEKTSKCLVRITLGYQ